MSNTQIIPILGSHGVGDVAIYTVITSVNYL